MKPTLLRRLFWLSLIALLLACGSGQTPKPTAPVASTAASSVATAAVDLATAPLEAPLPQDPAVRTGKLANGLRYYIRANQRPEKRAELRLLVDAGSVLEDDDQRGLAHFIEHMAFNGTERFAKHELVDYLQSIGMRFAADLNANTGFDATIYILKVPTDTPEPLEKGLLMLEQFAHAVTFDPEEIEKERGVVIEEWRLGRGAGGRVIDRLLPILFRGSRYADRLSIGDPEILRTASRETLVRFYRDWYRPDLMAVVVVGDVDVDATERQLSALFGAIENPPAERVREQPTVPIHSETLFGLITDPELPSTGLTVYYKLPKRSEGGFGDYRRSLVEGLYTGMLNVRLGEIAQRPDPPFLGAWAGSGSFVRALDVYTQSANVPAGGIQRGLEALLTEAERVDQHGFTASELERAKRELAVAFERIYRERDKHDSASFAAEYARNFFDGESFPGIAAERELIARFLPTITLAEVNQLAGSLISEEGRVIVATGPENAAAPLPSQEELLAVFQAVEGRQLEPWVDQQREGPLLAERPTPGRVVTETRVEEVGLTQWTLANGVRVWLRPTDFQNDQVLLSGWAPGGSSRVDDARYPSALLATTVVGESGLGAFSKTELQKALSGKVAQLVPFLDELEQGVRGVAAPGDLETLFELLYLSFTQPRLDDAAVQSLLTRMRSFLENRLAQPEAAFEDALAEHLWQGHPRRRPMTAEILDRVDPKTALEIYRERFADAGGFTFILVGNFDPAAIRPLVETYLGGLPAKGGAESWRDVGAEHPEGVVRFEVRRGLEPKSQVELFWTGAATWSRQSLHQLASLQQLLELRLNDVLREELGATYGVGVIAQLDDRPRESYTFEIRLGCGPEQVSAVVERTFAEIRRLKAGEISELDLTKIREAQRRRRETQLRQNGFWLGVLQSYAARGTDPRLILDFDQLVATVTTASMQEAARRYFVEDRYVLGILNPETKATPPAAGGGP